MILTLTLQFFFKFQVLNVQLFQMQWLLYTFSLTKLATFWPIDKKIPKELLQTSYKNLLIESEIIKINYYNKMH